MQSTRVLMILLVLCLTGMQSLAQSAYDKLNLKENRIDFPGQSYNYYKTFLYAFHKTRKNKSGKINILHLGDSHVQADFFTSVVRNKLKILMGEEISDRGFIFPYNIAKTNSPPDYHIDYSGNWQFCYKTRDHNKCKSGISGITLYTDDELVSMSIQLKKQAELDYSFRRIKVFYNIDKCPYQAYLPDQGIYYSTKRDYLLGCIEFELEQETDTLLIEFAKTNNNLKEPLKIYGMLLENDEPGLQYNTVGYNGATIKTFVESELMIYHLIPMNPTLVIISIGTNDGIYRPFKPEIFFSNFEKLILSIRDLFPEVPVLITTPNDNRFMYRTNKNNSKIVETLYALAEKYNLTVWNFYSIMGGTGSIKDWKKSGLVQKDMLHFTAEGYKLQGELLYQAILKTYSNYLNNEY